MIMHTMAYFDSPSLIKINHLCADLMATDETEMVCTTGEYGIPNIVKIGYDGITGVMGLENSSHLVQFIRHKKINTNWTRKETGVFFNHPTQIECLQIRELSEVTYPLEISKIASRVTLDNVTKMTYITKGFYRDNRNPEHFEIKIKYLENEIEYDKEIISLSPPSIIFANETIDTSDYIF